MSLEQQISKGIMEAMKAKEPVRLQTLRNIKKYIIEAKTAGTEIAELPDADVVKIIAKLAKQGLSPEELTEAVRAVIAEVGATSVKEMGKVMGVASKRLAGQADGKDISAKVRELLG